MSPGHFLDGAVAYSQFLVHLYIAHFFVRLRSFRAHFEQERDEVIDVIINVDFLFRRMWLVENAGIVRERSSPSKRYGQKERVEAWLAASLENQAVCCKKDSFFACGNLSEQSFRLVPLFEEDEMADKWLELLGQKTELLWRVSNHDRRALRFDGVANVLHNQLIALMVGR